ncbi:hypothetical protein ACPA9J_24565 [Pseudomonas aeruginosa]
MLLEVNGGTLRSVATDGHRLAICSLDAQIPSQDRHQVIVPRKGGHPRTGSSAHRDRTAESASSWASTTSVPHTGGSPSLRSWWTARFPGLRRRVLPRGGDNWWSVTASNCEALQPYCDPHQRSTTAFAIPAFQRFAENQAEQPGAGRRRGRSAGSSTTATTWR